MNKTLPYISVVINSYNGAGTIARTIDSFRKQSYPSDRFEIIVVNDGSSDDTADIARLHGAKVVQLTVNRGISAARNAGLDAARGEIFVASDDDCIAQADLLVHVVRGYRHGNPLGVGSFLVPSRAARSLIEEYMNETATGMESALVKTFGGSPLSRFWHYLVTKIKIPAAIPEIMPVDVLYGATGTFRVADLRAVGGWDVAMSGIEDRDVCMRLHAAFPDRQFMLMRDAHMVHDPDMSLWQYLLRPFRRGPRNLEFHQRYHLLPPLFPMPLLAATMLAYGAWHHPLLALTLLLVGPQVLYFWWPVRAYRRRDVGLLLFTYIQLAEESMVILGLIRGYTRPIRHPYRSFSRVMSRTIID